MDPKKPGWMTSEFWLTLVKLGLTAALLGGFISVGDLSRLEALLTACITLGFDFVANAVVLYAYIRSRTEVKKEMMVAQAAVQTAPVAAFTAPPARVE